MRVPMVVTVSLALALASLGPVADAAEPTQPGPERVTMPGDAAAADDEAPRVLRGSAVKPRPVPERPTAARFGVVGGELLWLVDAASGDVVACRERDTFTVGKRVVRCTVGDLPRLVTE